MWWFLVLVVVYAVLQPLKLAAAFARMLRFAVLAMAALRCIMRNGMRVRWLYGVAAEVVTELPSAFVLEPKKLLIASYAVKSGTSSARSARCSAVSAPQMPCVSGLVMAQVAQCCWTGQVLQIWMAWWFSGLRVSWERDPVSGNHHSVGWFLQAALWRQGSLTRRCSIVARWLRGVCSW